MGREWDDRQYAIRRGVRSTLIAIMCYTVYSMRGRVCRKFSVVTWSICGAWKLDWLRTVRTSDDFVETTSRAEPSQQATG